MLMRFDARARALVKRMTLAEKVGQITQSDQQFIRDHSDFENYSLVSVMSCVDSDL